MSRSLLLLIGIIIAVILAYFCITQHIETIPADIKTRVDKSIEFDELARVKSVVDGRDVVLSGVVADNQLKKRAQELAAAVDGVRSTKNDIVVINPIAEDAISTEPFALEPFNNGLDTGSDIELQISASEQCENNLTQAMEGKAINFSSDKAEIDSQSLTLLNQLAAIARNCPNSIIEVYGHTDSSGDEIANIDLSQRRAQAVADYFIDSAGLTQPIRAMGLGSAQPASDNVTEQGRVENRRIEFKVLPAQMPN